MKLWGVPTILDTSSDYGRRDPPAADGKRVPKKSGGLLRADATVAERCALIHAEKDTYDVTFMCRLLKVPRSSYYAWTHRAETPTRARRRALAVEVAQEFTNSRQTSGCRRIAAALNRRGIPCSVGLIADLMRELGLAAVQPRAYKRTTLPGDAPRPAPDLLERNFTATAPGTRLVGDITYLRTGEGQGVGKVVNQGLTWADAALGFDAVGCPVCSCC